MTLAARLRANAALLEMLVKRAKPRGAICCLAALRSLVEDMLADADDVEAIEAKLRAAARERRAA